MKHDTIMVKTASFDSPLADPVAASAIASGAAFLYRKAVELRNHGFDRHPDRIVSVQRPVISIGGIRAGGSGKTPLTMLLIDSFSRLGYDVAVLSRGYKRKGRAPLIIAPDETIAWEMVGDEPAMMRTAYPGIWLGIGANRSSSAINLEKRINEKAIFLLDDGFQHRRLHRDLDIVCIHESILTDRLLPQGYLREPIESLGRSHVLFLITTEKRIQQMQNVGKQLLSRFPGHDQFILINKIEGWVNALSGEVRREQPFATPIAVCGIARPERFFESLNELGVDCCKKIVFSDHYNYRESDFSSFRKLYSQGFVTTEKDIIRLKAKNSIPLENLWYLKMRLHFFENDSSDRFSHYIKGIDSKLSVYNRQKEA
jgi:tetraacyldisaccharide 4'-kinase